MRSEKWDHLRGLTYSVAVGSEAQRKAALLQRASVYIINRENVQWLVEDSGLPFDYDMVVIDELSSFKSYQAKRFRALLKVRPGVKRIVGPDRHALLQWADGSVGGVPVLDMGRRLGRFITRYRSAFFQPDKRNAQVVFSYKPLPGAEDAIYEKISDITISMRAGDYLDMPECVVNEVKVDLSEKERQAYDTMRAELVLSLNGEEVDAGNAAALANKLSQMANGAVYGEDNSPPSARPQAGRSGGPHRSRQRKARPGGLLVQARPGAHPGPVHRSGDQDPGDIADWNQGKIPVAVIHPASAGHGLNLQAGAPPSSGSG